MVSTRNDPKSDTMSEVTIIHCLLIKKIYEQVAGFPQKHMEIVMKLIDIFIKKWRQKENKAIIFSPS